MTTCYHVSKQRHNTHTPKIKISTFMWFDEMRKYSGTYMYITEHPIVYITECPSIYITEYPVY